MAQPFDTRSFKLTGEPFPVADEVFSEVGVASNADFSASRTGVLAFRGGTHPPGARVLFGSIEPAGTIGTVGELADYSEFALSPDGEHVATAHRLVLYRSRYLAGGAGPRNLDTLHVRPGPRGLAGLVSRRVSDRVHVEQARRLRDLPKARRRGGRGRADLAVPGKDMGPWDWSTDGRFLACVMNAGATRWDVYVLPLEGDRKLIPFATSEFVETRTAVLARWPMDRVQLQRVGTDGDLRSTVSGARAASGRSRPKAGFIRIGGATERRSSSSPPTGT